MAKPPHEIFVERRPDGRYNVSKPDAQRPSFVTDTQAEGIERARNLDPDAAIKVERVRNTDVGRRDKWRNP